VTRILTAFVLLLGLLATPALAQEVDPAIKSVTDAMIRTRAEGLIEQTYWSATLQLLEEHDVTLTDDQLAVMREAALVEVAPSYDYAAGPAYEAVAGTLTPEEAAVVEAALAAGGPDRIEDAELAAKLANETNPAIGAAMNGPVFELIRNRLGNYRYTAWKAGEDAGFIPEGLLGT
jgi:hypothetical protein